MQVLFILGIAFAITAVTFALQNSAVVAVTFGFWHFESSLAVVLLLAIGLGALITGLVSTPRMIKSQWDRAALQRQVARLEESNAAMSLRVRELESPLPQFARAPLPATEAKPYVGLKTMITGGVEENS